MGNKNSVKYTFEEISTHSLENDLWIVINKKIYDVSTFKNHPGGQKVFLKNAGKDGTQWFKNIRKHNNSAVRNVMKKYYIGKVKN